MYLLKDLWHGNVTPLERYSDSNGEYMKLLREANSYMDQLLAELSPAGAEILEKYSEKRIELFSISEEDSFIRGVRIGAQFILDVIGDYKSPLPQTGNEE